MNLPEVVKGALFARYSRYPGTLRRLFLDEFAGEGARVDTGADGSATERAERLYERVFIEFGDDSVAQLGGAHLACEWASNVLTKVLQRGRLAAYLEQSTRYIAYDRKLPSGRYRYYRDERLGPLLRGGDGADLLALFGGAGPLRAWAAEQFPRGDEPEQVGSGRSRRRRSTRCAASCPPPRSATSASTRAARPTSSS